MNSLLLSFRWPPGSTDHSLRAAGLRELIELKWIDIDLYFQLKHIFMLGTYIISKYMVDTSYSKCLIYIIYKEIKRYKEF